MDNTGSGQDKSQQPISQVPGAVQSGYQPVTPTAPPVVQPQIGPLPVPPVSSQAPAMPTKKITLEDLYGPSGFAESPATTTPSPLAQPTPPLQPVSPVVPQVQADVQPAPIPDLPTVGTKPNVEAQAQDADSLLNDLPLRHTRGAVATPAGQSDSDVASSAQPRKVVAPPDPKPEEPPSQKPSGGLNKLLLFRILFGAIGAIVGVFVLLFLVTWISGVIHPTASGKVTLTYWGLWEDSNTMQVILSDFQRQHPEITVQYEKEDPKQYSQRLLTRIQQGNGPDIFTYHSSWLPMVQSRLVPLPTSVISKDSLQNNFYPVVRADIVKNGALYGIPLEVDTLSLFVNNTIFQSAKAQVPTTWDTFTTTARALTQKDAAGKIKVSGAALGTYDNITHAPDIVSMLFAQNGVDIPTLSPKTNTSDALTFYTSFATGDSKVWDNTLDPSQLAFTKGNLAMYFGYSWDIFTLKAANPSLDFSVYSVPHLPGRNTTAASYWVEGVSGKSMHQKEALLFMQFLAQKSTQAELYAEEAKTRLFGEPYSRTDLGATLKNNPLVYPFVSQATDAQSSFFAGETQDSGINGQMNGYLGNAVRSILTNTSPDTAVDTLLQGVKQIENQYGSQ